jgi:hypothetical protein
MKFTKSHTVPAKTITILDHIKCELCEKTTDNEEWSPRPYEITEPQVSLKEGSNYPEGGYWITTVLDICPNCFKEKLIPWFKSLGGMPRREDHDW